MKKHAFLILAHDNPKVLSFLLSQLDDERNDVFILIDKKSSLKEEDFKLDKTNLYFLPRINVKWGHYSLVDATLRLLESATNKGIYQYYHLLGGTTLCTKSQDEIHNFYDNTGLEYFHINVGTFKSIQNRCKYYYPFIGCKYFRNSRLLKGMSIVLGKMQGIVGINRLRHSPIYPLYNGMEWFSITDGFARHLLEKELLIKKTFNCTLASDEAFIQTIAMHSPFRDRIYGYNGKDDFIDASKTYQFWNAGKSSFIDTKEKDNIVIADKRCFFARKYNDTFITLKENIGESNDK